MKKLVVLFLFLLCQTAFAQPMSVQTDQNWGFLGLATYTYSILASETLDLNDVFALSNTGGEKVKGFKFRVYGGDVMLAPAGVAATGTYRVGEYVASGTVFPGWTGLKLPMTKDYNFTIYPMGLDVVVVFTAW